MRLILFVLAACGVGGAALEGSEVENAFVEMKAALESEDGPSIADFFASHAFDDVPKDTVAQLQEDVAELLRSSELAEVKEGRSEAVVVLDAPAENTYELLMGESDGEWLIASPRGYHVGGASLDAIRGRKAALGKLGRRAELADYGESGYSFRYVTGDAQAFGNRVDVWLCRRGDLHAGKRGRIVDAGKLALKKLDGLPGDAEWSADREAIKGHTYVIHCIDPRDRDFYVALRVKTIRGKNLNFEWTVLGAGSGTPSDIHEEQPLVTGDGADGAAPLCKH